MSISTNNRNKAYSIIIEKLSTRRRLWFQLIKENEPCTQDFLCKKFDLPTNESGRITELKNLCLIRELGSTLNTATNIENTSYVTIKNGEEREVLINETLTNLKQKRTAIFNACRTVSNAYVLEVLTSKLNLLNGKIKALNTQLK